MSNSTGYYSRELERVLKDNEPGTLKLKITGANSDTKWIDLNQESLEALQGFISELQHVRWAAKLTGGKDDAS